MMGKQLLEESGAIGKTGMPEHFRPASGRARKALVLACLLGALSSPAWAADSVQQQDQDVQQQVTQKKKPKRPRHQSIMISRVPASSPDSEQPGADDTLAKYQRLDDLGEPGLAAPFALPVADSLTKDNGGWRSALAQHDIGMQNQIITNLDQGLLGTGQPRHPQRYNGQRFTLVTLTAETNLTFGLASWGLPDSKITVGANVLADSYKEGNGPNSGQIRALYYYQSFAQQRAELKIGWISNMYEYAGLFMGGTPVLANGISALIPIQIGLSSDQTLTPAVDFTLHGDHDEYVKVGVQRSVSPQGNNYETDHHNFWGLRFNQHGAGPLYIAETGIKREASAEHHQLWLRVDGMYNDSDYTSYATGRTHANRAAYAAGDYQLTQPSAAMPFRGVFVGASASWSPSQLNVYTRNYEARLYLMGPFDSRPSDAITFRAYHNKFSHEAQRALGLQGAFTNPNQTGFEVGYGWHAMPGVHLLPALAYVKHPSFVGDFNNALVVSLNVYTEL